MPMVPEKNQNNLLPDIRLANSKRKLKMVVVDDDPGGMHALAGVHFYLTNTAEAVRKAINEPAEIVFIVTDSRSSMREDAVQLNETLGDIIGEMAMEQIRDVCIVSRGDSTLRGHYPFDSDALRHAFSKRTGTKYAVRSSVRPTLKMVVSHCKEFTGFVMLKTSSRSDSRNSLPIQLTIFNIPVWRIGFGMRVRKQARMRMWRRSHSIRFDSEAWAGLRRSCVEVLVINDL